MDNLEILDALNELYDSLDDYLKPTTDTVALGMEAVDKATSLVSQWQADSDEDREAVSSALDQFKTIKATTMWKSPWDPVTDTQDVIKQFIIDVGGSF